MDRAAGSWGRTTRGRAPSRPRRRRSARSSCAGDARGEKPVIARGCGTLPGLRRGWPGFAKQRRASWRCTVVAVSPATRSECRGTRRPRRAIHLRTRRSREVLHTNTAHRCWPLSLSLCATFRVTRLGRCPNPVPPHGGNRCRDLPRLARGALPSSPRIFWKLPGPGGLPARWPAAPLHSI
jgi:hypothetical protein